MISFVLMAAIAGPPPAMISKGIHHEGVHKFCDAGRAVYIYNGYREGAMVVIPAASECVGVKPPCVTPLCLPRKPAADPKGRAPDILKSRKP